MIRRGGFVRLLVLGWATFQLLAPGATALAHGLSSIETSNAPAVHVEATGSATCPDVHSPDCGICRYLSGCALDAADQALLSPPVRSASAPWTAGDHIASAPAVFPPGRAPPVS